MIDLVRLHPIACASIALNLGSCAWYASHRQWGLLVYWAAAATITFAATFLRGWHG